MANEIATLERRRVASKKVPSRVQIEFERGLEQRCDNSPNQRRSWMVTDAASEDFATTASLPFADAPEVAVLLRNGLRSVEHEPALSGHDDHGA